MVDHTTTDAAEARAREVLALFDAGGCRVDWMRKRLPDNAIRVDAQRLPRDQEVIGFLSEPEVSIWFYPAVVRWDGRTLWSSTPGNWTCPSEQRWVLTHWLPLATAEAASGAGEREEWPVKWAGPLTVGNMIANLRTLPADMPIHSAYHLIREGKPSRLFVKHPTVSRERVDGREIKTGDESVPYSAVIWSHDRNPDAASLPPATDPAMGLDPATVERCAKIAEQQYAGTPGWSGHYQNAGTCIASAIRALAAAPTIPATGEAKNDPA